MRIPSEFYYQDSNTQYSNYPTGQIDINRLINGLAYWRLPNFQPLPKTLIVDLPRSYIRYQGEEIINKLTQLVTQGFTIYLWRRQRGTELAALDKFIPESSTMNYCNPYPITRPKLINQAADFLNLPLHQLFILDEYWMNAWDSGERPARYVSSYYLGLFDSPAKAIKILKSAFPPLSEIHVTHVDQYLFDLASYPDLKIVYDITTLECDGQFTSNGRDLLQVKNNVFAISDFIGLKKLWFKSIKLNEFLCFFNQALFNFNHLTQATLIFAHIDNDILKKFLAKAPNLYRINLKHYGKGLGSADSLFSQNRPIQDISLYRFNLTSQIIENLVENFPQLISLQLEQCHVDIIPVSLPSLMALQILELNECSLSLDNLQQLIKLCPNLENISLSNFGDYLEIKFYIQLILSKNNIEVNFIKKPDVIYPNNSDQSSDANPLTLTTPIDPVHEPGSYRYLNPKHNNNLDNNDSKNQSMVTQKLLHYCELTGKQVDLSQIPGLCVPLSRLFLQSNTAQWQKLLDDLMHWNNDLPIYPELVEFFDKLVDEVKKNRTIDYFIGDNLKSVFSLKPERLLLSNPWHAIGVKYHHAASQWEVYDPNFINGVKYCDSEALLQIVKTCLGNLINITDFPIILTPLIQNPQTFITEGGLLSLAYATNRVELLKLLPPADQYSQTALDGLLLRSLQFKPAWLLALACSQTQINRYTLDLLIAFIHKNPRYYELKLTQSLAEVPNAEQQRFLTLIRHNLQLQQNELHWPDNLFSNWFKVKKINVDTLKPRKNLKKYDCYFQPWLKKPTLTTTAQDYCQKLVHGSNKQLILCKDNNHLQGLRYHLERYCTAQQLPFIYLHSPDDLVCSAPFIERKGKQGILKAGPGGRLHNFLTQHRRAIIVINYAQFNDEDFIRLKSIFSAKPSIDGTPVHASIIGLAYDSNSIEGFDFIEDCPLDHAILQEAIPHLPLIEAEKNDKLAPVNLFHSPRWEELLLGYWIFKKRKLRFIDGQLAQALQCSPTVEISNGLWDDAEFIRLWRDAYLRGFIEFQGQIIKLPAQFRLVKREGYDLAHLDEYIQFDIEPHTTPHVLNPSLLGQFFMRHHFDESTHQLDTLPGLIEDHTGQSIHINLTRDLQDSEWARLWDCCRQYQVHLICHHSKPVKWSTLKPSTPPSSAWDKKLNPTLLLHSNDVDVAIIDLTNNQDNWQVIDISECSPPDLLWRTKASFNPQQSGFEFEQAPAALLTGLAQKQKIILKGYFSQHLADALAPLLLSRQQAIQVDGTLVIVSSNLNEFAYIGYQTHNHPNSKEPLAKQLAKQRFQKRKPGQDSKLAWIGLISLPAKITPTAFDAAQSEQKTQAFINERIQRVHEVLQDEPYVVLTGLTAVGKTTFVQQDFLRPGERLYQEETNAKAWVQDKAPGRKYLFIDETTLEHCDQSKFESLFNNPPGILLDGTYFILNSDYKAIFATNPLQYGGDRRLPSLFQRHGNAVLFNPLPGEFIYEKQIKPLLKNTALQGHSIEIAQLLLAVYHFVSGCSAHEVLISPREVEMMVILSLLHYQNHPHKKPLEIAQYYAYLVANPLVPNQYRQTFEQRFGCAAIADMKIDVSPSNKSYVITSSRQTAYYTLQELLRLHQARQQSADYRGGLGGVLLQGIIGTGKRHLCKEILHSQGYHKVRSKQANPGKIYYELPSSMAPDDKHKLLLHAFDEGAIVLIKDVQYSPSIERLLNALLMGRTPEGEKPKQAGFMALVLQRPEFKKVSPAISRRLLQITLEEYSHQEMVKILCQKGVTASKADLVVSAYERQTQTARENNYRIKPTFSDAIRLFAPALVKEKQREKDESSHRI